jgi:transketolase
MLLGGSADLTPSNNTRPKGAEAVRRGDFSGSYIHFGVREHGMGAILNGLTLHGLRPYGGTFLVFSDYMRPTIRLAAMSGLPVIYVFTHDSIGLGEDGPTHQPVEHLTALRAIPNLVVIRPADGNETAQAWRVALERRGGPTALILSRQALPPVAPVNNGLACGAYVLADADGNAPRAILLANGSEVNVALAAHQKLAEAGIVTRVVSMPSWELFDAQPAEYRAAVLPPGLPCLAVEAGVTLAWARYIGEQGRVIGLDRFGASAPYKILFEQFGLTVENVVKQVRDLE